MVYILNYFILFKFTLNDLYHYFFLVLFLFLSLAICRHRRLSSVRYDRSQHHYHRHHHRHNHDDDKNFAASLIMGMLGGGGGGGGGGILGGLLGGGGGDGGGEEKAAEEERKQKELAKQEKMLADSTASMGKLYSSFQDSMLPPEKLKFKGTIPKLAISYPFYTVKKPLIVYDTRKCLKECIKNKPLTSSFNTDSGGRQHRSRSRHRKYY